MKVEEANEEHQVTCRVGWEKGGREGFTQSAGQSDRGGEDPKKVRVIKESDGNLLTGVGGEMKD